MSLHLFTFNGFQENTYVLVNSSKEAIIIDPGMSDRLEEKVFTEFIEKNEIIPKMILNTHCHIDHILGVDFVKRTYSIPFLAHRNELPIIDRGEVSASMFGVNFNGCPHPDRFVEDGENISFGDYSLDVIFVPGHCPGHLAFIDHAHRQLIGGDVLFKGSVGRVDLPGCNSADLVQSIQQKLYILPDDYVVHSGHGPATTIGEEKKTNYFVGENYSRL